MCEMERKAGGNKAFPNAAFPTCDCDDSFDVFQPFLDDAGSWLHCHRAPLMEVSMTPRPFVISKSGLPQLGQRA